MHRVQRAGLPEDCRNPACLKTRPPGPANGAAHNLQRGEDGIRRNARRCLASQGLSPVSTARTCSVNSSAAIYSHRLTLEATRSARGLWKR
jgi:copper oxidase (laccase) domain-containing protein